jgi:hypothetical protein
MFLFCGCILKFWLKLVQECVVLMLSFDFPYLPKSGTLLPNSSHCCITVFHTCYSSVSTTLGDMANPGLGSAVHDKITNVVTWKAEKVPAGTEALIRITMIQASEEPLSINVQVEYVVLDTPFVFIDCCCQVPRILVKFIVPMKAASGVNIQSLAFSDCGKSYNPSKWIRYITNVSSYVVRL